MMDCSTKGRTFATAHPERCARGMNHGSAKLDEASVIAIRREKKCGDSLRTLALRYGVTKTTIARTVKFKNWRHLKEQA